MNIIVIDDDKLVTSSLKMIIEANTDFSVVGIGHDGSEGIKLYKKYKPDVVLLDIRMTEMNGLDCAREILTYDSDAKILFLTTFQDDEYIIKALHLGVKGYLLKQDFESIIPSLNAVFSGQTVFGVEIVNKIPHLLQTKGGEKDIPKGDLSDKEFELITLVAEGLSNKEISERLYLSEGTVRNYLSRILEKLELRDRTQLAVYYYKYLLS